MLALRRFLKRGAMGKRKGVVQGTCLREESGTRKRAPKASLFKPLSLS
jgi:hypothetical protein